MVCGECITVAAFLSHSMTIAIDLCHKNMVCGECITGAAFLSHSMTFAIDLCHKNMVCGECITGAAFLSHSMTISVLETSARDRESCFKWVSLDVQTRHRNLIITSHSLRLKTHSITDIICTHCWLVSIAPTRI